MVKNTGKAYEEFVKNLHQALIDSESHASQKNILVETNKIIVDRFGQQRQFDVYWEYELGGIVYKSAIECKDYNSSISIEKIDALIGKLVDLPGITPIFATTKGYQSGAQEKAAVHNVSLLIVREQNDSDWQDNDGNPYIKEVHMRFSISLPARITEFNPTVDGEWLDLNYPDLDVSVQKSIPVDQVFIEDIDNDERYSLHELENKLKAMHEGTDGNFTLERKFKEAYLYSNNRLKITGYSLNYEIYPDSTSNTNIDFSKELIGVIEYLNYETKTLIFKDRIIKR